MAVVLEGERIKTLEQATRVVRDYADRAVYCRDQCNVEVPGDKESTVKLQNKAYMHWLMNYGSAVGALTVLHRAGLISDNAFDLLSAEVFATLQPKVVGTIDNPVPPKGGILFS